MFLFQAALHGARFKGQDLKLAWNKPIVNISAVETEEMEPDEEEVCFYFQFVFSLTILYN